MARMWIAVEMPITGEVHAALHGSKAPESAVESPVYRNLKGEMDDTRVKFRSHWSLR